MTRVSSLAMIRTAEDQRSWPGSSRRTARDPTATSCSTSGVAPTATPLTNTVAPSGEELTASEPLKPDTAVDCGAAVGVELGRSATPRLRPTASRPVLPTVRSGRGTISARVTAVGAGSAAGATVGAAGTTVGAAGATVGATAASFDVLVAAPPASAAIRATAGGSDFAGTGAGVNVATAAAATPQTTAARAHLRAASGDPHPGPSGVRKMGAGAGRTGGTGDSGESVIGRGLSVLSEGNARSATSVALSRAIPPGGAGFLVDWLSDGNDCR